MDAHDSFIAQDSAGARADDLANSLLNFTTSPEELESLQSAKRQKSARDPMSHRIIEKRRRDRMNNCLADLSRLIPTSYLKQGQGRIEKTEIIEMAIKHIKTLQAQVDGNQSVNFGVTNMKQDTGTSIEGSQVVDHSCCGELFYQGFKECQDETLRYFVEGEAMVASDPFCVRVMEHLSSAGQRFNVSRTHTKDKKDALMDMETQSVSGASTYNTSSASTALPSLEPILPLLPTAGGMMVPASPVRNKQLRNLLSARALQQLEAEREESPSQNGDQVGRCSSSSDTASHLSPPVGTSATTTQLNPTIPVYTGSSISSDSTMPSGIGGHCDSSMNGGCTSSGYVSDTSAMDRFSSGSALSTGLGDVMLNTKDSSAMNVYKFKHNITKRFSQEGKVISQQYDGSSSTSSREAEDEHHHHGAFKHRSMKNKNRYASSSDSGPYPTSEHSGATSTSSHESIDGGPDRNRNRKLGSRALATTDLAVMDSDCCPRSNMPLPGFVLHPSGTHYMPMSVCYNNIPDIFENSGDTGLGPPVFHPISIPVHFRGPVISVPGSSLYSQSSNIVKSDDTASQLKDTKVTKKIQG